MIARFSGAVLGLLAFAVAVFSGIYAENTVTVTLSRGILALFVFCAIGFVVGGAAQMVVAEHERTARERINERYSERPQGADESTGDSTGVAGDSTGTET